MPVDAEREEEKKKRDKAKRGRRKDKDLMKDWEYNNLFKRESLDKGKDRKR